MDTLKKNTKSGHWDHFGSFCHWLHQEHGVSTSLMTLTGYLKMDPFGHLYPKLSPKTFPCNKNNYFQLRIV